MRGKIEADRFAGYVQGQSDLASVILEVMSDEADAFWCFAGLMDDLHMEANFRHDQSGMNSKLSKLSKLLRFVDSGLFTAAILNEK